MEQKSTPWGHGNPKKSKRRKVFASILVIFLVAALGGAYLCISNPSIPVSFARQIDKITGCQRYCLEDRAREIFLHETFSPEALGVYDAETGEVAQYRRKDELVRPASLMKLFTIRVATSQFKLDDVVNVDSQTLALVPAGSSLAYLKPGRFTVRQLYQAMLLPSGNDAAISLATAYGRSKYGARISPQQALTHFLDDANKFIHVKGYGKTVMTDPAGYNDTNQTTVEELAKVSFYLLKEAWFKNIVDKPSITVSTPDKVSYTWHSTNDFLDPASQWYDPYVKGVKTGSLGKWTNLEVLYVSPTRSYLIIAIGTATDKQRYEVVKHLFTQLDQNPR